MTKDFFVRPEFRGFIRLKRYLESLIQFVALKSSIILPAESQGGLIVVSRYDDRAESFQTSSTGIKEPLDLLFPQEEPCYMSIDVRPI